MRNIPNSHISPGDGGQGRDVDASWHRNAALWIAAVRGGHIPSRARVTNEAIVAAVLRHSPARVLDVGCGEGWLAARLSGSCRVTGFDVSPELIEAARRSCPQGEFHVLAYGDVRGAGLGPFDLAVANFSLFEEDLRPLLGDLRGLLHAGGRLVIQTLHPSAAEEGWQTEAFATLASLGDWQPMPWFSRSRAKWVALIEEAGFDAVTIEEPTASGETRPASLLVTARRASSRGTETPAPPSIRA